MAEITMRKQETKRELGLFYAIMIALNGAVGIEVFVLLNYSVYLAGPAVVLSLLLCGTINILTMLSFCELGAAIPEVGSDYTYAKVAYGGFTAFLIGWLRWISSTFGATLAAIGFAYMLSYFIPVNIPLIAVAIVIVFTVINVRGIKEIDAATVLLVLVISAVFIVIGLGHGFQPGAFQPLTPKGLPGIFAATAYSFVMFIGARSTVAAASRVKEPGKNIPRAILFSSLLIVVFYCLMAYVTVGLTPKGDLINPDFPFLTQAAKVIMGDVGGALITIAGMFAAITSLTTSMMVQSSIVRGLSRDGYFPKFLLRRHKRFGTPYVAIIISSIFLILFAATGVIQFVGYVAGFAAMTGFALVNLTLIKLRREKPLLNRPFKAPLYPFAPILGIIMSIILLVYVESSAFILGIEFIVLAVVVYYLRMAGYHHLRGAIGGINLGIGSFTLLLLLLIRTGFTPITIPQELATPVFYGLIFLSVTQFLAAALNITSKS